ncbi:unnamed protein product [Gulo gulo]|uniref:Uncharacterized protein n=1 Tax=Gulo gulo TaxID=48420 RepID=A0A9X9Q9D2_GULGU|nr:unnamed protein product [Gulo gulo]
MLPRAGVDVGMPLFSTGRSPGVSSPPRWSGGSSPPGSHQGVRVPLGGLWGFESP